MLNPIQKKIEQGMHPLVAFLSEQTCGEACWHAREEVCRCSCGGKNHGCLRSTDGVQPTRTCKLQGVRRELKAVGYVHDEARAMNEAAGITFRYADSSSEWCFANIPAKTKSATDSQIENWPELAAYRDGKHWTDDQGKKHYIDKPYLLWAKV